MQSNNLATPIVERLIHLLMLAAVAFLLATYVVPAVSERLEQVMIDAANVQAR